MDTNKKTIQINPELFKINGGNTTRKNHSPKNRDKIRMKTQEKKPKKMSTIKKNILKMIQEQQHERKKTLEEDNKNEISIPKSTSSSSSLLQKFKNEFDESLEYLSNLSKEVESKKQAYTIKRYPSSLPIQTQVQPPIQSPIQVQVQPKYGCLKNGKLPTYRNWLNQTQKNYPILPQPQLIIQNQNQSTLPTLNPTPTPTPNPKEQKMNEQLRQMSKIQQFEKIKTQNQYQQQQNKKSPWKCPKQKRTIRRTYFVGKSKVQPRVSVLVTNKTIRARTTLKQQELKQVPITEVKKYLLKNGFIKVGTSSPNNVLREMYENAQLICGEIKNHNPENLLYNYFNAPSEL